MSSFIVANANDSGEVELDIDDGRKRITARKGSTLLRTLADRDIFLSTACGGRGSCGTCKCKILTDIGPPLPTELPYLSPAEIESKVRLSCQVRVESDLRIVLPDGASRIGRFACTVESMVDLTYDIKEVRLLLPEGRSFDYVPGMFAQIEVPPHGDVPETTMRAYSFSSSPSDRRRVEFLVRLVPGGIVSTWVHTSLRPGQRLDIIAPIGELCVRDTGATMICVAGGSGMAPFKSIFNAMVESGEIAGRDVWYFFGAKTKRDLFYMDWLRDLSGRFGRFHFVSALSAPVPGEPWEGAVGLITSVLDGYLGDKIDTGGPLEGYLCGSPGMLDACMNVMKRRGMDPAKIYFDKYI